MEIRKELVNENKYECKCPYGMVPEGITVHNTANDASARNEASYMKSNNNEVSFHIAVDDVEAIQLIDFNRNAWHAGDGGNGFGNRKTIAIEICYSKSGGDRFIKAEKNAAIIVAKLLKEFDRVVLCCGASNPRDIKVPGREAEGIYFAVDFLKSTTKALWKNAKQNADGTYDLNLKDGTYISAKGKNVMVIGGGDTGNDCVGTSMRHGAKSVLQLEMMPKAPDERTEMNPWPEWPRVCKTDYGQQEAAAVFGHDPRVYQTTVKEFKKDKKGKVCKAVLVKLEPKKNEKTGRMMMTEVAGSEYTVDVDLVLIAAGFLGSQDYVTKAFGVEVNERTNVKTAPGKYDTNVKNVFTAGDMHRGQSLVVWAIREGREAAREVDISLMGYTNMYVQ